MSFEQPSRERPTKSTALNRQRKKSTLQDRCKLRVILSSLRADAIREPAGATSSGHAQPGEEVGCSRYGAQKPVGIGLGQ
jgi:hypothetical protein